MRGSCSPPDTPRTGHQAAPSSAGAALKCHPAATLAGQHCPPHGCPPTLASREAISCWLVVEARKLLI